MQNDLYTVIIGTAIDAAQESGGSQPGTTRASDGRPRISSLPNSRGIQRALAYFVLFVTDGRYSLLQKSLPAGQTHSGPSLRSHL